MRRIWEFGRAVYALWSERQAARLGAAIAFYSIFSLTPVVMVAVLVAGAFVGTEFARQEFLDQLAALVGPKAAGAVQSMLSAYMQSNRGALAGVTSAVTLLVGATGVLYELRNALDIIHGAGTSSGFSWFVRGRLWSLALIFAVGFLLLVSLIASAVFAAMSDWLTAYFPVLGVVAQWANVLLSLAFLAGLFGLLMRWLPSERQPWRHVWPGAVLSAVLLNVGKHLLGLYLGRAAFSDSFGAAGSLVVLVMWVYYAVQVFLLGAAFNEVRRNTARETG
ncbi:MAG TPA: YihY/virulence factor BrkB family protein [Burkholderiales bacterium]|nr:YihY/virulence factor BrkB family protein [Burkholderiales bacterium]